MSASSSLAPSRQGALLTGLAWLIVCLALVHVAACVYVLLLAHESPDATDTGASLAALGLHGLDLRTVRWLVASSAALAVGLMLVPYLLRQSRRARSPAAEAWSLPWALPAAGLNDTTWMTSPPGLTDRPGVIAVRLLNLDEIVNVHGRAVAHRALRATARALRENARKSDIVTRTGHDRFAVVLSDTAPATLSATASRLRDAVTALSVTAPGGQQIGVTPRLGWSGGEGRDVGALLDLAHAALHDPVEESPAASQG